jgi:hypothetical protein
MHPEGGSGDDVPKVLQREMEIWVSPFRRRLVQSVTEKRLPGSWYRDSFCSCVLSEQAVWSIQQLAAWLKDESAADVTRC